MQHPTWVATSMDHGVSLLSDALHQVSEGLDGAGLIQACLQTPIEKMNSSETAYPQLKTELTEQDLLNQFTPTPAERRFVAEAYRRIPTQALIRNHLRALSSILTHAKRLGWVSDNVVEQSGVMDLISQAIRNSAKAKAEEADFTQDELRSIFSSPVFAGCTANALHRKFGDAASWLPLLLYYTGARREEAAQLKVNEVKQIEGIHCLDIMTSGEDGERGVKTASSRRMIPLHQDLISRGFLSYVQTLPADGQLFPKLKPCPDGYYATAFGRAWGTYLRSVLKLDITAAPLHGFRHTFKTLCRGGGIAEDVMDAIAGHAANTVARGYGVMPLTRMAEELKKFPSIPS